MRIPPFEMERYQSIWEHRVEINLAESGVLPLPLGELLPGADERAELFARRLGYVQTNGTVELRAAIAALYPGAGPDQVLVTTGCAEANFLAALQLSEPGAEAVVMLPNYMQVPQLAEAMSGGVKAWWLRLDAGGKRWRPDLDELRTLVGPRTRLIALCTPNNPTGARLTADELDEIGRIADRHGAWVLSDEVYRGVELRDGETPSMWGRGERVLVTGGLSKAYALPGLRLGWLAGPAERIAALWAYHDYTTIAITALSDHLGTVVLREERRREILQRARGILRENFEVVAAWLDEGGREIDGVPPEAGGIYFLRYPQRIGSTELAERLRREHGVLIVPGDHFRRDGYFRLGYGYDREELRVGLQRLSSLLATV